MPTVLIGTDDGLHTLGADLPRQAMGRRIDAAVRSPDGVWAVADGEWIWRRPDAGEAGVVAKLGEGRANCVLAGDDQVWVGASEANLYRLTDGEPQRVESFDEVPGRDRWYTPWGGPPDVRSMAAGPDGTIFVNVHVGGVVRSTDGGATWADTMDIDADVHQVVAHPVRPGHAYAASARGLGVTTDWADTWRFDTGGLHAAYCRAVAVGGEMLYLSAAAGSGGSRAALYRRPVDADGDLERCTTGLPEWFSTNLDTFCLAAVGSLVVAGDANGTVYTSEDAGATWETAAQGLPGVRCVLAVP